MKRWLPLGLTLLVLAGVAFASTVNITDVFVFQTLFRPHVRTTASLPTASAYTGYEAYDSTKSALTVSDGVAWRSASPMLGSTTYDFPAIGGPSDGLVAQCAYTWAVAVTGAALTDSCSMSSNYGVDGGSGLDVAVTLDCLTTAANTVKGRACAHVSDGGTINLTDAGFYFRLFH